MSKAVKWTQLRWYTTREKTFADVRVIKMNFCRDVSCYRSNRYLLHTKEKNDDIHGNHFFTTNRENSAH